MVRASRPSDPSRDREGAVRWITAPPLIGRARRPYHPALAGLSARVSCGPPHQALPTAAPRRPFPPLAKGGQGGCCLHHAHGQKNPPSSPLKKGGKNQRALSRPRRLPVRATAAAGPGKKITEADGFLSVLLLFALDMSGPVVVEWC